jgi:TonB family protein
MAFSSLKPVSAWTALVISICVITAVITLAFLGGMPLAFWFEPRMKPATYQSEPLGRVIDDMEKQKIVPAGTVWDEQELKSVPITISVDLTRGLTNLKVLARTARVTIEYPMGQHGEIAGPIRIRRASRKNGEVIPISSRDSKENLSAITIFVPPQLIETTNFYPTVAHGAAGEDIRGTWIVEAQVSETGAVGEVRLSKLGVEDLNLLNPIVVSTFKNSIPHWTFRPGLCNGEPTESRFVTAITLRPETETNLPEQESVLRITKEVVQPQLVRRVELQWRDQDKRKRLNPISIFELVLTRDGIFRDVKVLRSSGDAEIDCRVIEAIMQWRYKPATLHGKPVSVYMTITMNIHFK